jgi:hypothetical protein
MNVNDRMLAAMILFPLRRQFCAFAGNVRSVFRVPC